LIFRSSGATLFRSLTATRTPTACPIGLVKC
jgi:hypothetical protein